VILSQKGWVRARAGHGIDLATVGFKDGDGLLQALECKTTSPVVFLSARGKAFTVEAANLPSGRGEGQPMNALVNCEGDEIVWMASGDLEQPLLMSSSAGQGFLCRLGDLVSKTRAGKEFMAVAEGARANVPVAFAGEPAKMKVAALSSDSRLLVFPMAELPLRPNGGVGVQLIALPDSVTLAAAAALEPQGRLTVTGFKRTRKSAELDAKALKDYEGKRAQRGRVCDVGFRPDAFA
jgi:topoisomerase-4 subunit A